MAHTFGRALHKDVRMQVRSGVCFAQSVSDMAIGGHLENIKNRISKYNTSLNTVLRFEFLEHDGLYVWFGNFQWTSPSNTCSVSWFEHMYVFCTNSITWQCALHTC